MEDEGMLRKKVKTAVLFMVIVCSLTCSSCSKTLAEKKTEKENYKKAMEGFHEKLSRQRVSWTMSDGTTTDISTRGFQFAVVQINSGNAPDLVLLKDTKKNLQDDGVYQIYTCREGFPYEVQKIEKFIGCYPGTGIYVAEQSHSYQDAKTELYYYLPDCSEKVETCILTSAVGSCVLHGDGTKEYSWYGILQEENAYDRDYYEKMQENAAVSEAEFNKKLEEMTGKTKMLKLSEIEFYANTEENREKYLK